VPAGVLIQRVEKGGGVLVGDGAAQGPMRLLGGARPAAPRKGQPSPGGRVSSSCCGDGFKGTDPVMSDKLQLVVVSSKSV